MDNNIIDKRTKGEIHVSHSPITRDKIGRGFEGFGRWRKSIKNQRTVGGKIVANCFGDSKEEAEANAAFIVKACNEYDKLVSQRELLLEALKRVISYSKIKELDAIEDYSLITAILTAKEAIKKCEPLT